MHIEYINGEKNFGGDNFFWVELKFDNDYVVEFSFEKDLSYIRPLAEDPNAHKLPENWEPVVIEFLLNEPKFRLIFLF
jgi:hypothetical protein